MDQITFRVLQSDDLKELVSLRALYSEVFREIPTSVSDRYLHGLLNIAMLHFFVAQKENKIVAGATTYLLPSLHSGRSELYIYDMAVAMSLQRRGIGSELLSFMKSYCRDKQIEILFVQAHAEDMNARSFYLKNGGKEIDVRQYEFLL